MVGLFQKDLHTVDTPRLLRLQEKLVCYSFNAPWVLGKSHLIADALSRTPVFEPKECQDLTIDTTATCLKAKGNPALNKIVHNYHLITYKIKDGRRPTNSKQNTQANNARE